MQHDYNMSKSSRRFARMFVLSFLLPSYFFQQQITRPDKRNDDDSNTNDSDENPRTQKQINIYIYIYMSVCVRVYVCAHNMQNHKTKIEQEL
jgi:hypothetical protein